MDIYIWKALSGKNVMLSDAYHNYDEALASRETVIEGWAKTYKLPKKTVSEYKNDILYKVMPLEILSFDPPVQVQEAPKQFESALPYRERVYGFGELRFHIIPDVDPFEEGACDISEDDDAEPVDDKDADIAYKVMFSAEPYRKALWHVGNDDKFVQRWKVSLDDTVERWLVENGAVELDKTYPQFYRCKLNGKTLNQIADVYKEAGFVGGDFVHCGQKPKTEAEVMSDMMESSSAYNPKDLYFDVRKSTGDDEDSLLVAFVPKKYFDNHGHLFEEPLLFSKASRKAMDELGLPAEGSKLNIFKLGADEGLEDCIAALEDAGFVRTPRVDKEVNKDYYFCVSDTPDGVVASVSDAKYFDKEGCQSDWHLDVIAPACIEDQVSEGVFLSTVTVEETEKAMLAAGFVKSAAFDKFMGVTPPVVEEPEPVVSEPVVSADVYGADTVYYYLGDDLLVFVPKAHFKLFGTLKGFELDEQLQILLSVVDVTPGRLPGSWAFPASEREDIDRMIGKIGIDKNDKIAKLL